MHPLHKKDTGQLIVETAQRSIKRLAKAAFVGQNASQYGSRKHLTSRGRGTGELDLFFFVRVYLGTDTSSFRLWEIFFKTGKGNFSWRAFEGVMGRGSGVSSRPGWNFFRFSPRLFLFPSKFDCMDGNCAACMVCFVPEYGVEQSEWENEIAWTLEGFAGILRRTRA